MTKKEKKLLSIMSCNFHYKKNIKKFMQLNDLSLSSSLNYIFDAFFNEKNKKLKLNETPRCSFSLEYHLDKVFSEV